MAPNSASGWPVRVRFVVGWFANRPYRVCWTTDAASVAGWPSWMMLPIAVCSDIGPLLLAKSGVDVSGILKPPALCLKANTAGVVQLH
jgi:hypothetical protein